MIDAEFMRNDLITSLTSRMDKCFHPVMHHLRKCLDFSHWVTLLSGNMSKRPVPFNKVSFVIHGEKKVFGLVKHLASLPQINNSHAHQLDEKLAGKYLNDLKDAVAVSI